MTAKLLPPAEDNPPKPALPSARERFFQRDSTRGILAILDQGVVSGTNFCATILVMRAAGETELGLYAVGFTVLVLILAVQQSLVCLPFTVFSARCDAEGRRLLLGSCLAHGGLLALIAAICLGLAAVINRHFEPASPFNNLWLVLAATAPFVLLREFARRAEFARLHVGRALAVDAALAVLQIGGLLLLAAAQQLTAIHAHALLGGTCAAVSVLWLISCRHDVALRQADVIHDFQRHGTFGRWVLAGNLVAYGNAFVLQWVLFFRLGAAANGALAACCTLIDLSNPFVIGVGNLLQPRASAAFHHGGVKALRSVIARASGLVGGVMALFAITVALWGTTIADLLFRGNHSGDSVTIALLGVAALVASLGIYSGDGLQVMERPRINLIAGLISLIVVTTAAYFLSSYFYLTGAAAAFLIGNFVNTALRATAFYGLTSERNMQAAAAEGGN